MAPSIAIVLAAGKGTRMKSDLPKVLVPVCGRPMIEHVLEALGRAGIERILVVVGYRSDLVRERLAGWPGLTFIEQTRQLGTGHAVMVCRDELVGHDGAVLIVTGDSPLVQTSSVRRLLDQYRRSRPACLLGTAQRDQPGGLGRIVRDEQGNFVRIVEVKDASPDEVRITEVNMSTYVFDGPELVHALGRIDNRNAQGEYYITDCPGILRDEGKAVHALAVLEPCEALSINSPEELAEVERVIRAMADGPAAER